jgi:hypothetical protein
MCADFHTPARVIIDFKWKHTSNKTGNKSTTLRPRRERCTWRWWRSSPSGASLFLKALILLGEEGLGLVL